MGVRFSYQLVFIFLIRLLLNTGRRFIYPFAPELSRSLAVPIGAITTVIASCQFSSLFGLFSGPIADRIGNKVVMRAGLALLTVGMLLCGLVPEYWTVFVGLVVANFGKTIFDPAVQSFVGHHVPYASRARVIGIIETAWAASTLFGIPAFALIIEHMGLRVSFFVLAVFGAIGWLLIVMMLPEDIRSKGKQSASPSILSGIFSLFRRRATAGMLLFGFWISMANDGLFIVYGLWLEESFDVSLVTLGFSTIAIGGAELLGESLTALFADKIGLKKTIIISLCLVSGAYFLLPIIGSSFALAMAGMFFVFLFFEIVMVTSFSLSTELLPTSRATMMSGFYAFSGIGRMVGVLIGGILWGIGGIEMVAWSASCFTVLGLISLLWGLYGWRHNDSE
ncbi:MAG: putative MFS family arabinose efflux permease [Desulforhopalus sp.]|jgi:predicted MFS family arabinose efflux permease